MEVNITHHHTILIHGSSSAETWISHSLLLSLHLQPPSGDHHLRVPLILRGRDFETHTLLFSKKQDARKAYDCLSSVIAKRSELSLYNTHKFWCIECLLRFAFPNEF